MHHQIIKKVLEKYRGLAARLAEITELSAEWWSSHGRVPRSINPMSSGNKLAQVEDYYQLIALYETAAKGAGVMLSEEIAADIRFKYLPQDSGDEQSLKRSILREATEVVLEMDSCDFDTCDLMKLRAIESEIADLATVASLAWGKIKSEIRLKELERAKSAAN